MKKFLLLFLCLFLLTSCSNTDFVVVPDQMPDTPLSVVSSDAIPAVDEKIEKQETTSSDEEKEEQPPAEPQAQTVSVVVYGLNGEMLFFSETEYSDGMTALELLLDCAKEKNIPVSYQGSKSTAYITSIGGLAEKQHGGMSGWIYTLNGESVMTPCGKCVLSPADNIEWKYITEF